MQKMNKKSLEEEIEEMEIFVKTKGKFRPEKGSFERTNLQNYSTKEKMDYYLFLKNEKKWRIESIEYFLLYKKNNRQFYNRLNQTFLKEKKENGKGKEVEQSYLTEKYQKLNSENKLKLEDEKKTLFTLSYNQFFQNDAGYISRGFNISVPILILFERFLQEHNQNDIKIIHIVSEIFFQFLKNYYSQKELEDFRMFYKGKK
jgi:hypothetical protein